MRYTSIKNKLIHRPQNADSKNKHTKTNITMSNSDERFEEVELSQKEQIIELIAVSIAILLLLGSFMKVMFF